MRACPLVAGALMCVSLPIVDAIAVDVLNEDNNPYQVIIQDDDGQRALEIVAGQTLRNICGACSISIETDDPIEAQGREIVLIKDGKLQIRG